MQDSDGNLLLAATGGSGIPASIATFQSSGIEHKVATTFDAGLTCTGTVTTDIIKSDSYLAKTVRLYSCLGSQRAQSLVLQTRTVRVASPRATDTRNKGVWCQLIAPPATWC